MGWYQFKPYVSVAQRRANAAREVARLAKKGRTILPIQIDGREIATTFWGKSWCDNLEAYSDYESRLPRGRTYVRNGSVVDLQIAPGCVTALVSGSSLYTVTIKIKPLAAENWRCLKSQCAGQIGSLIELLQGRLSKNVLNLVTQREKGLFPKPAEISIDCSCPDWADLCKHSAAVLYGVGARLDHEPTLFFKLRKVDHTELLEAAIAGPALTTSVQRGKKTIAASDLADVFGIELAEQPSPETSATNAPKAASARSSRRDATVHTRAKKGRGANKRAPVSTAATPKRPPRKARPAAEVAAPTTRRKAMQRTK